MEQKDEFDAIVRSTIDKAIACGRALERREHEQTVAYYRRKNADHERMVGELLELLDKDDLDGARDIVKAEYDAIHGPRD